MTRIGFAYNQKPETTVGLVSATQTIEPRAEVLQISQRAGEQPRPKRRLLAQERARLRLAPPHQRAPVRLRPHRHDARRVIPTVEPFVFDRGHGRRNLASRVTTARQCQRVST